MVENFLIVRTAVFAFMVSTAVVFSSPQSAEAREWNMCNLDEIPKYILTRIAQRADFGNIIGRMERHCPDAAAILISVAPAGVSQTVSELGLRAVATNIDSDDGLNLASSAGVTDTGPGGGSNSTGDTTANDSSTNGGTSGDSEGSSDGETSSDSGRGRGSNANNGGGNGGEGESPGKGKGANNDE